MSASLARLVIASIAMLAMPVSQVCAAAAQAQDAAKSLRTAIFESTPQTLGKGRFRLRAQLQSVPAPVTGASKRDLKLSAAFAPKATASCPAPSAIFFDGFETP
jgi:hypothetical protein